MPPSSFLSWTVSITVYTLRRGELASIYGTCLAAGRWQSTSSTRIYLQDATAMATNLKLSSEQLLLVKAAATPIKRKFDGKARVET
jgi:hypothetical protein